MTITKSERFHFTCFVIGPVSSIRIFTKSAYPDYGYALREDNHEFDIYNLADFLALAAARGCEIKTY